MTVLHVYPIPSQPLPDVGPVFATPENILFFLQKVDDALARPGAKPADAVPPP
jgi:hypothetical protein